MALLRDVNYLDYGTIAAGGGGLRRPQPFGADFKGPKTDGKVTPQTLFRDTTARHLDRPLHLAVHVAQHAVRRRVRRAQDVDAAAGHRPPAPATTTGWPPRTALVPRRPPALPRRSGATSQRPRHLAHWVHIDVLFQAYFNACLIMITPPQLRHRRRHRRARSTRATRTSAARRRTASAPSARPRAKALMSEVASRGLKVTWHKKWQVHRRLRPEACGGPSRCSSTSRPAAATTAPALEPFSSIRRCSTGSTTSSAPT